MHYKVGTRGSKLAVQQTTQVIEKLKAAYPDDTFEIETIVTSGDQNQTSALDAIGTKGVFVDAIEKTLLEGRIQLAVHSMKDMPDMPQSGLVFSRAWKREDPRDVLILRKAGHFEELKQGAIIGTGSKRRAYQLKRLRPDLEIVPIRGNVDTRIRKLNEPLPDGRMIDGIVLAAAGLKRLGRESEISQYLTVDEMIPAPSQGTLALELRADHRELLEKLNALADEATECATKLERGFLKAIGGDCHMPIGAYATMEGDVYQLRAVYGTEDGSQLATVCVQTNGTMDGLVERAVDQIHNQLYGC